MLIEALLFLVVLASIWFLRFRPQSRRNRRPPYKVLHSIFDKASPPVYDYVIVGAGPGGLAALKQILQSSPERPSVLLVEAGPEPLPQSTAGELLQLTQLQRLVLFAPENVNIPPSSVPKGGSPPNAYGALEEGLACVRPLRHLASEEIARLSPGSAAVEDARLRVSAYPRGRGVGGGSLIDWGLYLPSVLHTDALRAAWRSCVQFRLPAVRSPLSWAFAEAATTGASVPKRMTSVDSPYFHNSVFPLFLRTDVDGRRLPVASAVLQDEDVSRVHVLVRHTVTELVSSITAELEDGVEQVTLVRCAKAGRRPGVRGRGSGNSGFGDAVIVRVTKGVVLSAGVLHTPEILHRSLLLKSPPAHTRMRDALALPMFFRSFSHISNDAVNISFKEAMVPWILCQRGPYLSSFCDTLASIALPELGKSAELVLLLLPFGGKDASRFYRMGWDRVLGVFPEALTILMVLQGVDDASLAATLSLAQQQDDTEDAAQREFAERGIRNIPLFVPGAEAAAAKVVQAFAKGMRLCRRLVNTEPLSNVCTDAEVFDCTLLLNDPKKAVRLAQLMHLSASKKSNALRRETLELYDWAKAIAATEPYMRRYIYQHSYWLGFGSGSAEPFLEDKSARVRGLSNVFVGDCSAVTVQQWRDAGCNTLSAGSVATAMDMGSRAAQEMVLSSGNGK